MTTLLASYVTMIILHPSILKMTGKNPKVLEPMSLSKAAELGRYADTIIQLVRLHSQIRGKVND